MFVATIPNRNSRPTILLRETFREDGKVKNRTLANLTDWPPERIASLASALDASRPHGPTGGEVVGTVPHGHVHVVFATIQRLGLDRVLLTRACRERDLCLAMIVARILDPGSKLALARGLGNPEHSTLAETLGLKEITHLELYEALDWLLEHQTAIEAKLAKRHLQDGCLLLYDLTTVYLEGTHCELGAFGPGKEHRKGKEQILIGLLCNREGIPVSIQVFQGDTAECLTLAEQVQKVRERFDLKHVVFVADRGILRSARIKDDLKPAQLDRITALRRPAIRQLIQRGAFQPSLFDNGNPTKLGSEQRSCEEMEDLAEIQDPLYPNERLIVCRNPTLGDERARTRQKLLERTEKELKVIQEAVNRAKRPLRGQAAIGLKVGLILKHYKTGRFYDLTITDHRFAFHQKEKAIREDQNLDGVYVIRTSVPKEALETPEVVQAYKDLSHVETAFRTLKTSDLEIRPVYHHLPDRVRAHAFLCMLAYYVEWHMRRDLAPLLFAEEDPKARQRQRASVTRASQSSPKTKAKRSTRHTDEGFEIQSFRDVLNSLATLTRQTVQIGSLPLFHRMTPPTPYQQRVFQLLQISIP